ncbi:ras-related and estrogen-regulated growth inhibitor-like [Copidosoma floridanum]|uniref:ras-related and estrogen-regulated growth inhibitor-like n=1 Tax=Copidosoma floridanum TaxID=29053 RepID=UPI0006C9E22E|nr:ras-related and estrogen-regulated growth inhibitor-like [Copidosoma floridanum]
MQSFGSWQFNFGSARDSNPRTRPIRVLLLGHPGVGKTAIAVRFASRRFIGEYERGAERMYRVEDHLASWEIVDPPGELTRAPTESRLRWADAVVLVYSVTDRVSFDETWRLRFLLNQARKSSRKVPPPVVVLLGNKTDLGSPPGGDRMVTTAEGRKRAEDIEAQDFHEVSARESLDQVMAVFASTARLVQLMLPRASPATPTSSAEDPSSSAFRLRASTDGSIDARRRPQHSLFKRRSSISAKGVLH